MTHASLFSGIGGFDYAAQEVGFTNVFTCEIDDYCNAVLDNHFPNTERYRDITKFNAIPYKGKIDILTGGFPCQDISIASRNRKGLSGERSGLFYEMIRIVDEIKPKYVVWENSPMVISDGSLLKIYDSFSGLGYVNYGRLYTAKSLGFPHKRERYYGIAITNTDGFGRKKASIFNQFAFKSIEKKLQQRESNAEQFSRTFSGALSSLPNSRFLRTSDGFSSKLDKDYIKEQSPRIKALGNAIVPQIAMEVFKQIKEVENEILS